MSPDRNARPYDTVLDVVGRTPMIRLRRVMDGARTPVFAKAENFNPGGSVKDRIGLAIIEAAEREGRLCPGGTIVEGTAGNTGVGLAIAAAVKGYRCIFAIPEKMSAEKVRLVKAFGAEVVVTPTVGPEHPDYYGNVARRIAEERPGAILADQFYNPANPQAHYETTGPEIWEQTEGRVTHFVASPATGGTLTGVARYLKECNPGVRVVAGDPAGSIFAEYHRTGQRGTSVPYKVEGVGNDKLPGTLDFSLIDEMWSVADREAFHMARRITREEGILVGGASGLIVHVAAQVAREADDPGALVVCLLTDTGERYLSKLYNDEWMRENRMFLDEPVTAGSLLGQKEMRVPAVISVTPETSVREALRLLDEHDISQLPVLEDGRALGSVTEAAAMAAVLESPDRLDAPVTGILAEPFPTVGVEAAAEEVGRILSRGAPAVLVAEEGRVVGILTRHDLLHHLIQR